MRLVLAFLLALGAFPARAAAPPPDPLAVLIAQLSAPLDETAADAASAPAKENGARLAAVQASLTVAAAGFEALRAPSHAAAARDALADASDPALRPFLKNRDASLDAMYRTLAVVDYTWALRFPDPACAPAERRRALLQSADGLFIDPDVASLSPWMARLLGPASFGRAPEEALDQASAEAKLTASAYEKLRVRAARITEELSGSQAAGAGRAALYCERAGVYEQLARSHRANGPTLASRSSGDDDAAAAAGSVFLLAAPNGNDYDELGAGFLVRTRRGVKFVTDASAVRGRKKVYAFSRPAADGVLGRPIPVVVERAASDVGPAVGRLEGAPDAPALTLAGASPAADELVRGLGPLRAAGPWTVTQGLVTRVGAATFQSDAALSAEMAGSPLFNERGEVAGLMLRRGEETTALKAETLRAFLDDESSEAPNVEFAASSNNSGSASLLTAARPVDAYAWSAPGASAIESGLPSNLGGVNWEGGGGAGGFRPTGSAGPPPGSSSNYSSGYDSGGFEDRMGHAIGDPLGQAIGQLMVMGMQKLFQGIYTLFHPRPGAVRPPAVVKAKAPPPLPPPPPPEPKIIGLTVTVEPPDAMPGQRVTLIGQLRFQGDYKKKSGIEVSFGVDGELAYFGGGNNKKRAASSATDGGGRATATLTLEEITAENAKSELDDLDREVRRRAGDDEQSAAQDGLDAAPSASTTPVSPGAIRITAAAAGFADRKTIPRAVPASPPPPDCAERLKKFYPQQQDAQQKRTIALGMLQPALEKYGLDYEKFQAVFPKLLVLKDEDACGEDSSSCSLRANKEDWSAAQAAYGQVQAQDQRIEMLSFFFAGMLDACKTPDGDARNPERASAPDTKAVVEEIEHPEAAAQAGVPAWRIGEIREAYKALKSLGVPRKIIVQIIDSFEPGTIRVRTTAELEYGFRLYGEKAGPRSRYLLDMPVYSRDQMAAWPENSLRNIKQWAIPKGTTVIEGRAAAIEYAERGYAPSYPTAPGQKFAYPGGARQIVVADPAILQEVNDGK